MCFLWLGTWSRYLSQLWYYISTTYLPITITINDELDQFGNQGPVVVEQTKEERDAKAPKTYLGNVKVVWSYGTNVEPAPRDGAPAAPAPKVEEDLPF